MGKALRRVLAQQEELVGPAELADWMAQLFPEGEARKRRLMDIARTGESWHMADPPHRASDRSGKRGIEIPKTAARVRVPPAPPLPASLLVMVIGVATVLTVVVLDWLR